MACRSPDDDLLRSGCDALKRLYFGQTDQAFWACEPLFHGRDQGLPTGQRLCLFILQGGYRLLQTSGCQ